MGYRGEDLDLRTPQTWTTTPADLTSWQDPQAAGNGRRGNYRTGPILVDDTVLACTNHAFDVALAHRAGEVTLEHLLHAMTRIDVAAEALEARGVRVAALRRESATIIASELPIGNPDGKGMPRRSDDLEDVLRASADLAYRRGQPANIDDLLNVLIDLRLEFPSLKLLSNHMSRIPRDYIETRYVPVEPMRVRVSTPPQQQTVYVTEPPRMTREYAGSPTDQIQNTRIEALEQMVRALGHDLANERKTFMGILADVQREVMSQRDETNRASGGLYDRLQSIQQAVHDQRQTGGAVGSIDMGPVYDRLAQMERSLRESMTENSRSATALADKLKSFELSVASSSGGPVSIDMGPLSKRLEMIEEALLLQDGPEQIDYSERLQALETSLADIKRSLSSEMTSLKTAVANATTSVQVPDIAGPLAERFNTLASGFETRQSGMTQTLTQLAERLTGLEQSVASGAQKGETLHNAYTTELGEVHEALMKLNANQHTLASSIDQWRHDGSSELRSLSTKVQALTEQSGKPMQMLETLYTNMDSLNRTMIERYHRRNRFWYWLFGTDDWVTASWPSQVASIEEERRRTLRPLKG